MKVVSKLVKMDFAVGKIERKDRYIIIHSDPERSTLETRVRPGTTGRLGHDQGRAELGGYGVGAFVAVAGASGGRGGEIVNT